MTPLVIPQVDGTTLPIALKEPSEASKTLGVRAAPDGNPVAHLAHMKKCGLDWGDKLHTTYLPRRLAWMSHDLQLYPQMSYGLECLLATPMELSKEMQKVIRHCLPSLGVNRNIKSEFATISHKYQGISLPDWTAEKLAIKMLMFSFDIGVSQMLWENCYDIHTSFSKWKLAYRGTSLPAPLPHLVVLPPIAG
jgi:hypothetical protein